MKNILIHLPISIFQKSVRKHTNNSCHLWSSGVGNGTGKTLLVDFFLNSGSTLVYFVIPNSKLSLRRNREFLKVDAKTKKFIPTCVVHTCCDEASCHSGEVHTVRHRNSQSSNLWLTESCQQSSKPGSEPFPIKLSDETATLANTLITVSWEPLKQKIQHSFLIHSTSVR